MEPVDFGFFKSSFLQAAQREDFQKKWMSSDNWAKFIAKYCISDSALVFDGTRLDKCWSIHQYEYHWTQMDMRKEVPKDQIGVFRDVVGNTVKKEQTTIMLQKKGSYPWLQRLYGMKT